MLPSRENVIFDDVIITPTLRRDKYTGCGRRKAMPANKHGSASADCMPGAWLAAVRPAHRHHEYSWSQWTSRKIIDCFQAFIWRPCILSSRSQCRHWSAWHCAPQTSDALVIHVSLRYCIRSRCIYDRVERTPNCWCGCWHVVRWYEIK